MKKLNKRLTARQKARRLSKFTYRLMTQTNRLNRIWARVRNIAMFDGNKFHCYTGNRAIREWNREHSNILVKW